MPHSYEVCLCVFLVLEIMHNLFFVPLPDVTARRNTIANALELVKVTKGKVGVHLNTLSLSCFFYLALSLKYM